MGWFARTPSAEDAVGTICRLLVERPWEWVASTTGDDDDVDDAEEDEYDDEVRPVLTHASGVSLIWSPSTVWLGNGSISIRQPTADARRLFRAIQGHAAALVARRPFRFTDAAQQLADAVKAGDDEAVWPLVDELLEYRNQPPVA